MGNLVIPSQEELENVILSISEGTADEFMDMALEDVKSIFKKDKISNSEISYKMYRAYLIGYAIGLKQNTKD